MLLRPRIALLGTLALTACASPDSELHLGPIFSRHTVPGLDRVELAGGLLRRVRTGSQIEWAASPLFSSRSEDNGRVETDFLFPLGRAVSDPTRPRSYFHFLPLFWSETEPAADGVLENRWFLLPLLMGGSREDGTDSSFGIFPLFGKIRGFLGWDELNWVLFPLFVRTVQEGRRHVWAPWPILGWQEGGNTRGFHLWPLFSYSEHIGRSKRTSVLWPIWTSFEEGTGRRHPRKGWMLWPLLGHIRQADFQSWSFAWPIVGWASRPSTHYQAWHVWPLLKLEDAPEKQRSFRKFLPFYARFETPEAEYFAFAIPLFWNYKSQTGERTRVATYALPLWVSVYETHKDGREARTWQLWPLIRRIENLAGDSSLKILSPGLSPVIPPDALSRNLGPFFELWSERKVAALDLEEKRSLGGLYHEAAAAGHRRWSLPLLGGRWTEPDGTVHVSLLAGLLRWKTDPQGNKRAEAPAFPGPGWPSLTGGEE